MKAHTIPSDDIVATDAPDVYTVVCQSDKNTTWIVDLQLGECTGLSHRNASQLALQTPIGSSNEVSQEQCQYYIPTYSPQGRQLFAAVALGQRLRCQPISFYSSVHQRAEEEHLKSLSISVNWSDEDIKSSFEKIAPCSCDTTEVAIAADDNIDFSNTFQRDQEQAINRGSYEKSRDVIVLRTGH